MKRVLSAILAILLLAGLLSAMPVMADDENLALYTYEVTDGEATITKADAAISGDITIPSQLGGCPVTVIGAEAFAFCTQLNSVIIPDTVTKIEEAAFYECSGLAAVEIPDSVTSLGKGVFYKCTSLTEVCIPDSVTETGDYLFAWCSALTDVVLSNAMTKIGECAFYACEALTEVVLPASITRIEKAAFYECSSLCDVTICGGITNIADYAFAYCGKMTDIAIADTVTQIGEYAFSWCTSLTEITIPDSVTTMGRFAFARCSGLDNVVIGKNVSGLAEGTFYACDGLREIIIGEGVSVVSNHAFAECTGLTKVTIPVSVTRIGVQAFDGCDSLRTVRYCADEAMWQNVVVLSSNECLLNAGIVFDFVPIVNGRVEFWRLILQDRIGISFQMEYTDAIADDPNAYVEITVAGETSTVLVSEAMESIYVSLAAAQMTDEITVCVVSGEGNRGENGTYSVKAYADQILTGKYDKATQNLVKALLCYGAMAQDYFNYREENLANENVDFVLSDVPAAEEAQPDIVAGLEGISLYGASLLYDSKLAMRLYFETDSINRFTFTIDGKQVQPVEKSGRFYVQIPHILPQNLGKAIAVSVSDDQGNTVSVLYTPMDYVRRMYHKAEDDAAQNLLQALYTYHLAAKKYAA